VIACSEHLHRRWIQGEFFLPANGEIEIQTSSAASKGETQEAGEVSTLAQESLAYDNSEGVAALFLTTPTVEVSEK
jgi:hypothetical protein